MAGILLETRLSRDARAQIENLLREKPLDRLGLLIKYMTNGQKRLTFIYEL